MRKQYACSLITELSFAPCYDGARNQRTPLYLQHGLEVRHRGECRDDAGLRMLRTMQLLSDDLRGP